MKNAFRYEKELWDILDDEVFLIEYYPDFKSEMIAKMAGDEWRKRQGIENYLEWTLQMFVNIKPIFIGPDDIPLPEGIGEMIIIRLQSLATVLTNFKMIYQNGVKKNKETCVNDLGIDPLIKRTHFKLSKQYLDMFIERFERLEPIKVFLDVYKKIALMFSKLQKVESANEYFDQLYQFQEFLSDYIDDLDELNFDVAPEDMFKANEILKYITIVETQLYYLLLLNETLEYTELVKIGINDIDSKPLVLERDERIQMVEALNNSRVKS
ncbi:hypothetical protein CXP39_03035 [Mesoplasma syrphidae]|uniref:Uncharacterized protein n=1 Tax=Mesoplasma syrphidae TaxID=225999 RepID=A0A2K9BVL4_9MOLU|nr:hypothetical protein [Mesoplasma syrphidae]AUF83760.1 hypothetical protein CXP39_03035 [Mesoplasma syrphidae]